MEDSSGAMRETSVESLLQCIVCAEDQPTTAFPDKLPSTFCTHTINTCTECTRDTISHYVQTAKLEGPGRNQYQITCPQCPRIFDLDVAEVYMDKETFQKQVSPTWMTIPAL